MSFLNLPVNMYIIHSSLWRSPINPKYHPMLFNDTKTKNRYASVPLQFNSVHSIKRTEVFLNHRVTFLYIIYFFIYNIDLVCHYHWNKASAISHTYFSPIEFHDWLLYLKINLLRVISLWYGYMKWQIFPSMKYYHTLLWFKKIINDSW